MNSIRRTILLVSLCTALTLCACAQSAPSSLPSTGAAASPATQSFDINAAVNFYLAKMPAAERARSNAYFEGGYWLLLWDFLANAAIMILLMKARWSARMRDLAVRIMPWRFLQPAVYWIQFFITLSVLTFPLTVYEGFFREHKYGLSNQTFGPWMRDQLVSLAVAVVLGAILVVALFFAVRRLGRNWWVWGAAFSIAFLAFVVLIAPVYISPLFNTYESLEAGPTKDSILSLARANGIDAKDVFEVDESRQSSRVSANVSGIGRTMRISLNDNLIQRCTLPEIETTMGHEIGHYVLNHLYKDLLALGVIIVIAFALVNYAAMAALARWGESWGVREITDVAVLPLALLLFSTYSFVLTPINNTLTRASEFEADMYGLNTARQPDGEANVDLLLGEYRKMEPGPIEEFIFFDHPSGRTRITAAMRWKAEHPETASPEEMARPMFNESKGK